MQGLDGYENFTAEATGETMNMVCANDKEAAKLFGLYLDHKVSLPKLEECGEGLEVHIFNGKMSCTYKLWRAKEKIYAEAIYYKMVGSLLLIQHFQIFWYYKWLSDYCKNKECSITTSRY